MITAAAAIVLNLWLVPAWGPRGGAVATVAVLLMRQIGNQITIWRLGLLREVDRECLRLFLVMLQVTIVVWLLPPLFDGSVAVQILTIIVGSLTVFDTQRLWRAPLYEDLAYLLISVKAASPQVRCQGGLFSRRQLATWGARFLNAYFDETPPPLAAVRLYECLLLLEWWAAVNFRHSNGTLAQRAARTLSNRYLSRYIQSLLADISAFESKSPASR